MLSGEGVNTHMLQPAVSAKGCISISLQESGTSTSMLSPVLIPGSLVDQFVRTLYSCLVSGHIGKVRQEEAAEGKMESPAAIR